MSNLGSFDSTGAAVQALEAAVTAHGPTVLQHTAQLRSALGDLGTQAPRESGILLMAADAGIAQMLTQQVNQQGVDPAGAIRLSSGLLGERTSLDPQACSWATSVFAQALGLVQATPNPGPGAAPGGWGQPVVSAPGPGGVAPGTWPAQPASPWPEETMAANAAPPAWSGPSPAANPTAAGWAGSAPAPGWAAPTTAESWSGQPPSAPATNWAPPVLGASGGPPVGGWGPSPATTGGNTPRHNKPLLIGVAIVLVVVILGYFGAAAGAHLPPFSKSKSTAAVSTTTTPSTTTTTVAPTTTTPSTTATTSPTTTATTVGPFAAQSRTVAQLMPADIPQSTDCQAYTPPVTGLVGLTAALECLDPSLPGGTVFGLQFGSAADYAASVKAFNTWLGFDAATAGQACPPTATGGEGTATWYDSGFPQLAGQDVECLTVGTSHNIPDYSWFYPNQDALFDAQGAPSSSLLTLSTWWTDHGDAAGAA